MATQQTIPHVWGVQDHTGQTFGKLTALRCIGRKNHAGLWVCRCTCGMERELVASTFTRKKRPLLWCGDRDRHLFDDVDKQPGEDGCWLWTGSISPEGYGRIGRLWAHRRIYEIHVGPIPDGYDVMHKCDVCYPVGSIAYRRCVRPDHLTVGTRGDNIRDCVAKDRHARGERNGHAKLTNVSVTEIRRLWQTRIFTVTALSKRFKVSRHTISDVVWNRTWKHLAADPTPTA